MALLALVAAFLLWYSLDLKRLLRGRAQWRALAPALAAVLLGLALVAKGALLPGTVLVAAGALWAKWPRRQPSGKPAPATATAPQSGRSADLLEASDLLGVAPDADRDTVIAAHRRLIARNHPDNGGTEGLAARLNAARDVLLQQSRR